MKTLKTLSIIACLLVIAGAVMQIMHVEGGRVTLVTGIALFFVYLGLQSLYRKKQAACYCYSDTVILSSPGLPSRGLKRLNGIAAS